MDLVCLTYTVAVGPQNMQKPPQKMQTLILSQQLYSFLIQMFRDQLRDL